MEPMDFIGSCEGRWQRNEVAQSKDGGVGFDWQEVPPSSRWIQNNGEMREEVGGVGRWKI